MTKLVSSLAIVLCLAACAHTAPPPADPTAPSGHQADAPPPAAASPPAASPSPSPSATLSMSVAQGCARAPSSMAPEGAEALIICPQLQAMVIVLSDSSGMSPHDAIQALSGQLTGSGWTATPIADSADGSTSSTTVHNAANHRGGKLVARRLRASPAYTLILMGQWSDANAAQGAAVVDGMTASATLH